MRILDLSNPSAEFTLSVAERAQGGFFGLKSDSSWAQAETPDQVEGKLAGAGIGTATAKLKPYHYLLSEYVHHSWFPARPCRSVSYQSRKVSVPNSDPLCN